MDTSEKRFENDIEQHLISHGYEQFNGQDAEGDWVHIRQHDIVRAALRVAKEVDATDEEWKAFMEMLQNRQN